jgi:hypothetical protein
VHPPIEALLFAELFNKGLTTPKVNKEQLYFRFLFAKSNPEPFILPHAQIAARTARCGWFFKPLTAATVASCCAKNPTPLSASTVQVFNAE